MKYLSKEPMVFLPPRVPVNGNMYAVGAVLRMEGRRAQRPCDHKGKVHVLRGRKWFCSDCGGEIE